MPACQPITAVAGYTESHSRKAPSNRDFKSEAKIRLGKCLLFLNYDYFIKTTTTKTTTTTKNTNIIK